MSDVHLKIKIKINVFKKCIKEEFSFLFRITLCEVPKQIVKRSSNITVYNQTKNGKKNYDKLCGTLESK